MAELDTQRTLLPRKCLDLILSMPSLKRKRKKRKKKTHAVAPSGSNTGPGSTTGPVPTVPAQQSSIDVVMHSIEEEGLLEGDKDDGSEEAEVDSDSDDMTERRT